MIRSVLGYPVTYPSKLNNRHRNPQMSATIWINNYLKPVTELVTPEKIHKIQLNQKPVYVNRFKEIAASSALIIYEKNWSSLSIYMCAHMYERQKGVMCSA